MKRERERERETHSPRNHDGPAVARVGVGDDGHGAVERGQHGRVAHHVVGRRQAQVGRAQRRDGRARAGLSAGDQLAPEA